MFCRSCSAQHETETAYIVGHGIAGLHDIHDPIVPGVSPAPQVFRLSTDGVGELVNADGVPAPARLGGISGAGKVAGGFAEPVGVVRFHATEALGLWKERRVLLVKNIGKYQMGNTYLPRYCST